MCVSRGDVPPKNLTPPSQKDSFELLMVSTFPVVDVVVLDTIMLVFTMSKTMLRASSSIIIRSRYRHSTPINITRVFLSSSSSSSSKDSRKSSFIRSVSAGLPDWIEHWSRDNFCKVGYGLALSIPAVTLIGNNPLITIGVASTTALYWAVGLNDLSIYTSHSEQR